MDTSIQSNHGVREFTYTYFHNTYYTNLYVLEFVRGRVAQDALRHIYFATCNLHITGQSTLFACLVFGNVYHSGSSFEHVSLYNYP